MPVITELSDQGDVVLVELEGDVLRAYRDSVGFWTIGTGLTAASGVVRPKAGMVITRAESRKLRRLALARNYESAVAKALPTDKQNVFDGAVIWHWNTGAIARASWVKLFLAYQVQKARISFLSWNKAGGKVLPGLVTRRNREWNIIEFANYGKVAPKDATHLSDFSEFAHDFAVLGYDTTKGPITTVVAFQRDHNLTQDGLIGPATRATLARVLATRTANKAAAGGAATGAAAGGGTAIATVPHDAGTDLNLQLWMAGGALAIAVIVLVAGWVWRHRGPLFSWLPEPVKDFAEAHGVVLGRRLRA